MSDERSGAQHDEPRVDDAGQAQRIQAFWEASRTRAGLGRLANVVVAASWVEEVPPPAWSFGDSAELADELVALVLSGEKRGTSSAVVEYRDADEPLPSVGELSIVLDGSGDPCALVRTTRVDVVPFGEVTEEFAAAEGERDGSLASWRAEHEAVWRRTLPAVGAEFDATMDVVCEWFELLYPQAGDR